MAFQFENNTAESKELSAQIASSLDLNEFVKTLPVTDEYVNRCGSLRSAQFAAVTATLTARDVRTAYAKARLYSVWKDGFKTEKNTIYKSVKEVAENAGESRQAFEALAKVGKVFFSADSDSLSGWTNKNYSPWTLFELSNIPADILSVIDTILSESYVDENGREHAFHEISTTTARRIKEAFAACGKNAEKFTEKHLNKEKAENSVTLYGADEFLDRIFKYKLLEISADSTENQPDENENGGENQPKTENSEKSGYSNYTFIVPGSPAVSRIYAGGEESKILNYMGDNGYKVIATEHNKFGVIRTFVKYDSDNNAAIRVIGVFPQTVASLNVDVQEYNKKVLAEMEAKGAGEYFRPFNVAEYVEAIQTDTFADNIGI